MQLQKRVDILVWLGEYMQSDDDVFELIKQKASQQNPWFTPEFINLAVKNIATEYLQPNKLESWIKEYPAINDNGATKTVGIVMAGNIPLVGFHDLLCVFLSGHAARIKPSSKDEVLIKHVVEKMIEREAAVSDNISFAENLKGCDAYIATGSNNSGRYFEYYFGRYPSIIRHSRTSVALLDANETREELDLLADDIQLYFGMGCRNVTMLYVPANYDFIPLLTALRKYDYFMDFHKYRHNYDYQLALLIMNNKFYMSNESLLLTENQSIFSPVSRINYSFYEDKKEINEKLKDNTEIQCIIGRGYLPFGSGQAPSLHDYADGVDTMQFLSDL
jgi:hypothetical protein